MPVGWKGRFALHLALMAGVLGGIVDGWGMRGFSSERVL